MEKVSISILRSLIMAILMALILYLILYFKELSIQDLKIFTAASLITMVTALLLTILKKYKSDGLYFSKDGITLIIKNVAHTTSWDIIRPSIKIKYKYLYHIAVNLKSDSFTPYTIAIYWPTEGDILEKTK